MLAAALTGVLSLGGINFVHIYTQELTAILKAEIASTGARAAEANERAVTLETTIWISANKSALLKEQPDGI